MERPQEYPSRTGLCFPFDPASAVRSDNLLTVASTNQDDSNEQ
jgi:hypothetical protein